MPLKALIGGGLVWDNHLCMPLNGEAERFLPELERCHAAGVDLVTLGVGYGMHSAEHHLRVLATYRDWFARHRDRYQIVGSMSDARAARKANKLGVCFDIEGMNAVLGQPELVRLYYDLGVRWMLIAYNNANAAGGGCLDAFDPGLSDFGRAVISQMNQVGMLLCCTHTAYRTAREAIDFSADPVIFSHSNSRSVFDHPRNIPDELARACAERGGIIGVNGIGLFLGPDGSLVDAFVRHVEHFLDVVGEDHVAIGTDYLFDQSGLQAELEADPEAFPEHLFPRGQPFAMMPPWHLPRVAQLLSAKGCRQTTLTKLFGGNLERVAERVWKPSA